GSLGVGAFMSPYNPGDLGALVVGGYSWAPALTSDWADSNHGCRVTTTGEAYCWGYNVSGQLGTGNNVATLVPTAVTGGLLFDDVGTSEGGTCGIQKTTGSPYCWGNILGDGTGGTSSTPVKVSTTDVYTSVSGGADYMCGLRADGKAYCWGSNSNGQLGIGTLATTSSNVPVAVAGGLTFATLTTGYRHACGVTALGAAYCWGLDTWAQLGSGAGADDTAPALVQGGYTWAKVSAGQYHTCGVTTSNVAYCWGSATYGQLGNGDIVTPQPAPSLVSGGYAFKDIATGINNSCAITTTDTAYCWGSNSQGQLGNDSLVDVSTPVAVLGGKTFKNLSMSYSSTCGMTLTNEVRCWGAGTFGRLGNALASKATALDTAHLWTAVEAGDEFACGIAVGGALYCWGSNTNGKLGDGGTERKSSPTAVSGGLSWKKIAVGKVSACGVTSTDAAYCWGGNANGQIGNSSATASFDTPQLVSGGLTWTHISVGSTHACGIATGGAAYCWGNNTASGYLGNGSAVASTSPVLVSGGLTWISISAGHAFSCGVATGGTGYCWGSNTNYEHGRGVTTLSNVPAPISGGLTLASIFAGSYGACAVTTAGAGYCWGYNGYGAVGDGTAVNKTVPTLVLGGHVWREISVGTYHSCGITTAGAGYCWGKGADGAVGSGAYVDLLSPAAIADVTDVKALAPSVSLTIGVAGP
ncbi:MAG TPA: hypothetical protein VM432_02745, partial [Bdellovibrionales bacterium]|nr:hypothetical protein [Bdellovibrionales bacterium]